MYSDTTANECLAFVIDNYIALDHEFLLTFKSFPMTFYKKKIITDG